MAIYHLTAKTVSRGNGSAKQRSEYIDRESSYKRDHDEVLYKASGNMPEWVKESRQYWKAADTYERGNGRLFKQLEFALPKELSTEDQKNLVKCYVDKITTTKDGEKLPYSYAIHKGHDRENPHCHLMISERAQDGYQRSPELWFKRANNRVPEKGGAKKTTALMPKEWLYEVRQEWSKQANKALERTGCGERIDHRSLNAQGIDREPTKHRGPALNAMLMSGKLAHHEVEKDISQPIDIRQKEAELANAKLLKQSIDEGLQSIRHDFQNEKKRQVIAQRKKEEQERIQEEERQRIEQERQRKELELQRQQEAQRQRDIERQNQEGREQRQKSRGMGMSR